MKLYMKKLALLLGSAEPSNNRQLYFVRNKSRILSALPVNFALILAGAVAGIFLSIRARSHRRKSARGCHVAGDSLPLWFAVPYAISIVMFFITSRYRLPVAAILIPHASYGIYCILGNGAQRARHRIAAAGMFIVVFGLSIMNPFNVGGFANSRGYYDLGVDYTHSNYKKAVKAFSTSLTYDPTFAPTWKMRGWTLHKLGHREAAIDDLLMACHIDSTLGATYFTLGVIYQEDGEYEKAKDSYETAIRYVPTDKFALNNLADICMRENDLAKAHALLMKSLSVDPNFKESLYGLGYYYERMGKLELAIQQYSQALPFPGAQARLSIITERREPTENN
jgi:tetratricopeptide (TPR) repeat protein